MPFGTGVVDAGNVIFGVTDAVSGELSATLLQTGSYHHAQHLAPNPGGQGNNLIASCNSRTVTTFANFLKLSAIELNGTN